MPAMTDPTPAPAPDVPAGEGGLLFQIGAAITGFISTAAQIDALIRELTALEEELREKIEETVEERDRKIRQAKAAVDAELGRIQQQKAVEEVEVERRKRQEQALYALAVKEYGRQLADLEAARTLAIEDIERQIEELEANKQLDAETRVRLRQELENRLALTIGDLDRKTRDLMENKDAAIAEAVRQQTQLLTAHDVTLDQLLAQAQAADVEATRKVAQIQKTSEEMLGFTRDQAIIQMNEAGAQGRFDIGRQAFESYLEVARVEASASVSGVRRSGSPLLALRQTAMLERENVERVTGRVESALLGEATETTARLAQLKSGAQADIENVAASNLLFDQGLERQRQNAELAYIQTYENLEATKTDVNRQFRQDAAAYDSERAAALMRYSQEQAAFTTQDLAAALAFRSQKAALEQRRAEYEAGYTERKGAIEGATAEAEERFAQTIDNLETASAESARLLDQSAKAAWQRFGMTKDDLIAAAGFLTREYTRRLEETGRKKETFQGLSGVAILAGSLFGKAGDVLSATESFLARARTEPTVPTGSGASAWYHGESLTE